MTWRNGFTLSVHRGSLVAVGSHVVRQTGETGSQHQVLESTADDAILFVLSASTEHLVQVFAESWVSKQLIHAQASVLLSHIEFTCAR